MVETKPIVLASGSQTRHRILKAAGVAFTVDAANIDEEAIRQTMKTDGADASPSDIAEMLARTKGETVSARRPDEIIVAADQVLDLDGQIFSKPDTTDDARETLKKLRGKTHTLHSAVVIAEDGSVIWSNVETAHLTMRRFTPDFLANYLLRAGEEILQSVGAYQIENTGIQLFEKIEGDYFTILGLPLIPLLAELRKHGNLIA